jgi:hypothetical protein
MPTDVASSVVVEPVAKVPSAKMDEPTVMFARVAFVPFDE